MGARTWPAPNENDINNNRFAIELRAQSLGLNINDPAIKEFINGSVLVQAELTAENRWLYSVIQSR